MRLCPLGKQSLINYDLDIKLACLKIHGEIPESYIFWIHDWVISAYDVGVDDSDHNDASMMVVMVIRRMVVTIKMLLRTMMVVMVMTKDGDDDDNAFKNNDGGDGDD